MLRPFVSFALLCVCGSGVAGCSTTAEEAQAAVSTSESEIEPAAESTPVEVINGFAVQYREGSDASGVANILCATDEVLVGGGCVCTGDPDLNEGGFLFGCAANGNMNGYVGACYDLAAGQTANPVLVRLQCAKVTTESVLKAAPGPAGEDPVYASARAKAAAYRNQLNK